MSRVFFFAMDSGDPVLLDRWMNSGDLPNLAKLRSQSAIATVEAPAEMGNGTLWQTVATGVNMGRHGLHFIKQLLPGSYRMAWVNEDVDCKEPPIWQRLDDRGKRCIVIDMFRLPLVPLRDGLQISEWMPHFSMHGPRSAPASALAPHLDRFGRDPLNGNADIWILKHRDYGALIASFLQRIRTKTDAILHYLTTREWDLFMAVYSDSHDAAHMCWHLHSPTSANFDAEGQARWGDPIAQVYREIDAGIGRLLPALRPDDVVLFFAGLGIQDLRTPGQVFDRILDALESGQRLQDGTVNRGAVYKLRTSLLRRLLPDWLRRQAGGLLSFITERADAKRRQNRRFFTMPCEWHAGAVRINLAGREPQGKVAPADFDAVCAEIERDFRAIVNADTGTPLVTDVIRTREHYHGPHLDLLPDLFIVWDRSQEIRRLSSPKIGTLTVGYVSHRTGDHTPFSLLLAKGPGIAPGHVPHSVRPEDVGATLMALAGAPDGDLDGRPVPEVVGTVPAEAA
jgi:predicted AlkP superfamily phosphohydrolase/phosphomutase